MYDPQCPWQTICRLTDVGTIVHDGHLLPLNRVDRNHKRGCASLIEEKSPLASLGGIEARTTHWCARQLVRLAVRGYSC